MAGHSSHRSPLSPINVDNLNLFDAVIPPRKISRHQSLTPKIQRSEPVAIPSPKIPRLSVSKCREDSDDDDDDVFDGKENLFRKVKPALFPSLGTSPGHALCVNSPGRERLQNFGLDLTANRKIKRLGKGGFGTVVLGTWKGQRVAVKVIPRNGSVSKTSRRTSLDNELNAIRLDHENVVKVHGIFDHEEKHAVILMEYVGRSSLQDIIEERPAMLTQEFVQGALCQIIRGLRHCHGKGILHLDLKPANILVTSTGHCKLADFGCSSKLDFGVRYGEGGPPGTPGYQAPELLRNQKPSVKCDVYSFGILSWQLFAKESVPYPGLHPHTIIFKVVSQNCRPVDNFYTALVNERSKMLYMACWRSDPDKRPTTDQVQQKLSTLLRPNTTTKQRRTSSSLRL